MPRSGSCAVVSRWGSGAGSVKPAADPTDNQGMRSTRTLLAALGIALIVVGVSPMSAQARYDIPSESAPGTAGIDAWIVSGRKGPIGAGVHSPDGDGQTLTKRVARGRTVMFTISAKRTGSGRSSVTFLGCAGAPGFAVAYRLPDGSVVTLDVTGAGYDYRQVDVGDVVRMKLTIDTTGSRSGDRAFCGVGAYTPDRGDVVGARVVIE